MAIGYKLFEMNINTGELFPLFIGKNKPFNIGEWIHAEYLPTKGFASRGGLHIGANYPSAPHLIGIDGTYTSKRGKNFKRVWCEVEYNDNHNYNDYVATLPKKCITDGIPEDGFYNFKEANGSLWIISSDMKIIKVLTEDERCDILKEKGFNETEAVKPRIESLLKRKETMNKKC